MKKEKKKKIHKGSYGYIQAERKKRLIITLCLFAVPLFIFFTSWIYHKTRLNIFTVVAVVGCLPACKSTVTLIMMLRLHSIPKEEYKRIAVSAGDLKVAYELYITAYEKNAFLDALVICGNTVAAYSSDAKIDIAFTQQHIQKILRGNGYKVTVKIFTNEKAFLERLTSLAAHREELEAEIKFTPNPDYPDMTRSEWIMETVLAISL